MLMASRALRAISRCPYEKVFSVPYALPYIGDPKSLQSPVHNRVFTIIIPVYIDGLQSIEYNTASDPQSCLTIRSYGYAENKVLTLTGKRRDKDNVHIFRILC
jgi:hypothetical protein